MPPNLERGIEALRKMWRAEAILAGDDPEKVTPSLVVRRLLETGLDLEFATVFKAADLSTLPASDAEWSRFEEALEQRLKQRR